jgi:hypothetical protein
MITTTHPQTLGASTKHPARSRSFALTLAIIALATACSPQATSDTADQTVIVPESYQSCLTTEIDGVPDAGEVCVNRSNDVVTLQASGLAAGSTVTVQGADGNTVEFDVSSDEALDVEVGGEIVASTFDVTGTWSDGEDMSLSVDYTD